MNYVQLSINHVYAYFFRNIVDFDGLCESYFFEWKWQTAVGR